MKGLTTAPYNDSPEKIKEINDETRQGAAAATDLIRESNAPVATANTVSWRDVLPIHRACQLFPEMSPDELKALGEDIKASGLTSPIAITASKGTETGWSYQLLDGRNRLDAMEAVGIPARLELLKGQCSVIMHADLEHDFSVANVIESDPYAYVISANIHRRHLTAKDKDRLIVELLKADPTKSNRQVAKLTDTSHPYVAKVREKAEKTGDVETVTTSIDTRGREQPSKRTRKTTTKPQPTRKPDADAQAIRDNAAKTIRTLMAGQKSEPPPACDDIGANSASEAERLQAQIEELQCEIRRRDFEILDLRSEIKELKEAASTTGSPTWNSWSSQQRKRFLGDVTLPGLLAHLPDGWRPMLEARLSGHLSGTQLVDLLENRLGRDGINATAPLQKLRKLIDRPKTIDLKALPAAGAA
jgi:ParB-like chromosome segregation protein Spo0J